MKPQLYHHNLPFSLEAGGTLPAITIAYHTWGKLNDQKDNVIWICHALTANSNAADWWKGMIGPGLAFDTDRYFVICANILGSVYGTTGPVDPDPASGQPYFHKFPLITIRDMVNAHELLRGHLGIQKIFLLAGGSMGGYQVLEWTLMQAQLIEKQFLIATSARETPWGIAIHTAQRLAIEADNTWEKGGAGAGAKGLAAARAIGMLTYRGYHAFMSTQSEPGNEKLDDFKASSYIKYQGDKLTRRFNAYSYYMLSKALDSHNIARGRGESIESVLQTIEQPTLVMGISSDLLCPVDEQKLIASNIPGSRYLEFDSPFGHDGFLVETAIISTQLMEWLEMNKTGEQLVTRKG
ncbi:MAG TPA: homoserine O-acetyltransferase [Flavisolibacter sp.]|nr:homoserine O-acetyltransferase [Flavisolibacter sp.]